MEFFKIVTPFVYWLLFACWLFILIFYLRRLKSKLYKDKMITTLLIILSIDSFRTVIESSYFGAWYTSLAGLIPIEVFNTLAQPNLVFFPKILNLVAAIVIIFILIRKWIPNENQRIHDFTKTIENQAYTYNRLLNSIQDVIIAVDFDWKITDANQAVLKKQFGYEKEEIINKNFSILQDSEQTSTNSKNSITFNAETNISDGLFEMAFKKKNGELFISELFISKIDNNPINHNGHFIVIRDITKRKETEESLLKLSSVVEQSPSSVIVSDLSGTIEYVNPKFEQLTGYTLEEVLGKKPSILQSGKQSIEFYQEMWNTILAGKEWQ